MDQFARPTPVGPDTSMDAAEARTKKCPYCAETILEEAIVCRFCGRELTPARAARQRLDVQGRILDLERDLRAAERDLASLGKEAAGAKGSQDWAFGLTLLSIIGLVGLPFFGGNSPIAVLICPAIGILAGAVWGLVEGGRRGQVRDKQKSVVERIEDLQEALGKARMDAQA